MSKPLPTHIPAPPNAEQIDFEQDYAHSWKLVMTEEQPNAHPYDRYHAQYRGLMTRPIRRWDADNKQWIDTTEDIVVECGYFYTGNTWLCGYN